MKGVMMHKLGAEKEGRHGVTPIGNSEPVLIFWLEGVWKLKQFRQRRVAWS
jgi:hypothetical protein